MLRTAVLIYLDLRWNSENSLSYSQGSRFQGVEVCEGTLKAPSGYFQGIVRVVSLYPPPPIPCTPHGTPRSVQKLKKYDRNVQQLPIFIRKYTQHPCFFPNILFLVLPILSPLNFIFIFLLYLQIFLRLLLFPLIVFVESCSSEEADCECNSSRVCSIWGWTEYQNFI
jgi:hypothetical protein